MNEMMVEQNFNVPNIPGLNSSAVHMMWKRFLREMGTLSPAAPLVIFDKSRLISEPGVLASHSSLIHYITIQHSYTYAHPWHLLICTKWCRHKKVGHTLSFTAVKRGPNVESVIRVGIKIYTKNKFGKSFILCYITAC